jgi:hypothetical protein
MIPHVMLPLWEDEGTFGGAFTTVVTVAHFPPLFVVDIGNPVIIVQTGWMLDGGQVDGFDGIFDTTGRSSVVVNIHLTQPRVGIALTKQENALEGF